MSAMRDSNDDLEAQFFSGAAPVTIEIQILKETLDELRELLESEGLNLEQGVRTMLCRGLGYAKSKLYLSSPHERTERIAQRLAELEPLYAVLKFEAYGLMQDNRALTLRETSLRSSLDLVMISMEQLRDENERLRAELTRLGGEIAQSSATRPTAQETLSRKHGKAHALARAIKGCLGRIESLCSIFKHV